MNYLIQGGFTKLIVNARHYLLKDTQTSQLNQRCQQEREWSYEYLQYPVYSMENCVLDCAMNLSKTVCDCIFPIEPTFYKEQTILWNILCDGEQLKKCFFERAMKVIILYHTVFRHASFLFQGKLELSKTMHGEMSDTV